jgi:uncharacterized protein (TIGR02145 family)
LITANKIFLLKLAIMKKKLYYLSLSSCLVYILTIGCKKEEVPRVFTKDATNITSSSALVGGIVYSEGTFPVIARGVCWKEAYSNPYATIDDNKTSDGQGFGIFSSQITGLIEGTQYIYRAYASSGAGTVYGENSYFTTLKNQTFTTLATNVLSNSATLNGCVDANELTGTLYFEYGISINYGQTVIVKPNPGVNTISATIHADVTGLEADVTYHYRVKAINSDRTKFGGNMAFTPNGVISDIDGNKYNTVHIGNQTWMAENLKSKHFQDGSPIPQVDDLREYTWENLTSAAFCNYYSATYYNWYAVIDSQKICPVGWHIPTESEFEVLGNYLGGNRQAGGKLKESGTINWANPNTGATNESGFNAIPFGYRGNITFVCGFWANGPYYGESELSEIWTSSEDVSNSKAAKLCILHTSSTELMLKASEKYYGLNIRCIKDK